ncbi:MAG: phosphoribosylanthranilate isomerase [Eubacteriales bacterium]|nr:phosphoribosylanthranilate isomerase [Eubacteriales bacterium]
MSTKIKICGIRRPEDCEFINEAKPDYAGFIFWPKSFRNISKETAAGLRKLISDDIKTVGVFVDESPEIIKEIVDSGAISIVQLHGAEDAKYIAGLRRLLGDGTHISGSENADGSSTEEGGGSICIKEGGRVPEIWKACKVRSEADICAAIESTADMILLDNGYGTGECFDHSLIRDMGRDFILAGGLTPENIPDIISRYGPAMVDISSGVETDGFKDRDKILRAVRAARNNNF